MTWQTQRQLLIGIGIFVCTILPHIASAHAIPYFGPVIEDQWNQCPLGWAAMINVINNLITIGITFAITLVAPIMIAYSGFMLVVNPFKPDAQSAAKNILLNTVIGIVIALAAWLIVDAVMAVFYDPSAVGKNWSELITSGGLDVCLKQNGSLYELNRSAGQTPGSGGLTGTSTAYGVTGVTSAGSYTTGGSCIEPNAGPCSVSTLSTTCFANRADQVSQVCQMESGGHSGIKSGTDLLNSGAGPSYSIGLWQINLTTSSVGGLNCPQAFSGACQGSNLIGKSHPGWCKSKITNQGLYDKCVLAAQDPGNNTQVACSLYGSSSTLQPWAYSANRCNVPTKGG